jgi:hypothetical protein
VLKADRLLSARSGTAVAVSYLIATFAFGAVRIASRGLTKDADEYRDGDQRDHDQDDQGYDGYTHGLYLFSLLLRPPVLPGSLILTDIGSASVLASQKSTFCRPQAKTPPTLGASILDAH